MWQHVKLSDFILGTCPGYSLVVDVGVKTNQPTKQIFFVFFIVYLFLLFLFFFFCFFFFSLIFLFVSVRFSMKSENCYKQCIFTKLIYQRTSSDTAKSRRQSNNASICNNISDNNDERRDFNFMHFHWPSLEGTGFSRPAEGIKRGVTTSSAGECTLFLPALEQQ